MLRAAKQPCACGKPKSQVTTQPENLRSQLEQARSGLWYYEGSPDQHCELLSWVGEDVTLRPINGSPSFVCNGSFVWPATEES